LRYTREMARIRVYSTRWCGYCVRAKALLDGKGLEYEEVFLDDDPTFRQKPFDLPGGWRVPQIWIDGKPIGGYAELWRLERDGLLDDGGGAWGASGGWAGGGDPAPGPAGRG